MAAIDDETGGMYAPAKPALTGGNNPHKKLNSGEAPGVGGNHHFEFCSPAAENTTLQIDNTPLLCHSDSSGVFFVSSVALIF